MQTFTPTTHALLLEQSHKFNRPEFYKTDLDCDKAYLETYAGPFIWILRISGTNIVPLRNKDDYEKTDNSGEFKNYQKLINFCQLQLDHYSDTMRGQPSRPKEQNKVFHYDGTKLKQIDFAKAKKLLGTVCQKNRTYASAA